MRMMIALRGFVVAALTLLSLSANSNIVGGGGGAGNELSYADALAVIIATEPIPADELPPVGMFYLASEGSNAAPLPGSLGLAAWDLGDGNYLVNDLDGITSSSASTSLRLSSQSGMSLMMNALDEPPSPGTGTNDGDTNLFSYTNHTNGLWLEANGLANGYLTGNLHNATNYVYALLSKTNLSQSGWTTEAELFPGANTTSAPFSIPWLGRENVFLQAMDWSGVTHCENEVPDWWLWRYFGTTNLSDTMLDYSGSGYTLAQDFANSIPPQVFSFNRIVSPSFYANSSSTTFQLEASGYPYYIATLIDNQNFANPGWDIFSSTNVSVNGLTEGWHQVWIGLCGLGDDPEFASWQSRRIKVDTTPPQLFITGPSSPVDIPMIQLTGYSLEDLSSITYDINNLATNQQIDVTNRFFDNRNWEFTTNYFQGYDISLAEGQNTITIHATDLAGNTTNQTVSITVDYSQKTSPPQLQVLWPTNGTVIADTSFTLDGQLTDPTVTINVSIVDTNGYTNVIGGLVERTGRFWVPNISIGGGTNTMILTAVDVRGNTATNSITVIKSSLTLTVDPVNDQSLLWQPTITLTGTISDSTYAVWINGVKGTNNGNGTWTAQNVPVDDGGTASFEVTSYSPDETQPDGSHGN